MKMKFVLLFFLSTISVLSYSQVRYLRGTLSGSQQVPPVASPGRGTVIATYDMSTNILILGGIIKILLAISLDRISTRRLPVLTGLLLMILIIQAIQPGH